MNDPYRIELFGGLRVQLGTPSILKFRTRRVASLLARLAYTGRMESRETLIEWLWPDCDLEVGRNRFSVTLSSLRRALEVGAAGSVVQATHTEVGLVSGAVVTDVTEFEAALQRAEVKDNGARESDASRHLLHALELYRGELLAEHYDDWIVPERRRLAERFFRAACRLEELVVVSQAESIEHLQRALSFDPTREDVTRALMRSYAKSGQIARALRYYHDLERVLQAEGGALPAPVTRQLKARLEADAQHSSGEIPPLIRSAAATHLPLPRNRFFGRDAELRRLVTWAFEVPRTNVAGPAANTAIMGRLVTLTGSSGSGKTRLALEAAREGVERGEGDIHFVPLMDTLQPEQVPDAILRTLGIASLPGSEPLDAVIEALNRRPTLLILDNVEHLVDGGAALIAQMFMRTSHAKFLVTSQRRLGLLQETEFVVPPLFLPALASAEVQIVSALELESARSNEAVQLFVARAQAIRPNFQLSAENVTAVVRLCRVLEGVPLALELAAARARALSPSEMLAYIGSRLDFLQPRRDEAELYTRHHSLRAALDWSYDLLTPDVQRCFRQLAVFQGGWTLEDAEAVCFSAQPVEGTTAESAPGSGPTTREMHELLCENSLLETREQHGTLRFRFLETVREYALEQARQQEVPADWHTLQHRHAARCVQLAEQASQPLRTTQNGTWIVRLAGEQPNLRAALSWALEHEPLTALRLSAALWWFWFLHDDLAEGRAWLARALQTFETTSVFVDALAEAEQEALRWQAEALCGAGFLAWRQGDFIQAGTLSARSLELSRATRNSRAIAYSIIVLLMTRVLSNDFETANTLGSECLQLCRELGDQIGQGFALHLLAATAEHAGNLPSALSLHEQSVALFRALGAQDGMAYTLLNMGNARRRNGEPQRAIVALDESLVLFRELSNREGEAYGLLYRAMALALNGEHEPALNTYRTSLNTFHTLNLQWGLAQCLEGIALALGDTDEEGANADMKHLDDEIILRAARLWSAAQAIRETIGAQVPPVDEGRFTRFVADLSHRLDASSLNAAWQTGRVLTREQILRDALVKEAI